MSLPNPYAEELARAGQHPPSMRAFLERLPADGSLAPARPLLVPDRGADRNDTWISLEALHRGWITVQWDWKNITRRPNPEYPAHAFEPVHETLLVITGVAITAVGAVVRDSLKTP